MEEFERGERAGLRQGEIVTPRGEHRVERGEFGRDDVGNFHDDFMQARCVGQRREIRRHFVAHGEAAEIRQPGQRREGFVITAADGQVGQFLQGGQRRQVGEISISLEVQ